MAAGPLRSSDPQRLGQYDLIERLGEGGQGIVYLARNSADDRVAVKLLRAELSAEPGAAARFMREVETAKRVARFCTAAVLDADVEDGRPYIVSEYVEGPSLRTVVETDGPRTDGPLERLAVSTATALAAIHEAGVAHRDLKPNNVLLGPDGARVIDFGISRVMDAGATVTTGPVGTPAYMAPEQLAQEAAGAPADVFAWAATMVFASCGTPPFGAEYLPAVMNRILHEEPELGDGLTSRLRPIVADCLAKDPLERPAADQILRRLLGKEGADGDALAARLNGTAGAPPTEGVAEPPSAAAELEEPAGDVAEPAIPWEPEPAQGSSAKKNWAMGAAALVMLVLVAGLVAVALRQSGEDSPPRHDAASPTVSPQPTPSPTPTRAVFSRRYAGTWTGSIVQNDGRRWPIRLKIARGAHEGTVRYPQPGCSGTLTVETELSDGLELTERITKGKGVCTDSGAVTLRIKSGVLRFSYSGSDVGGRTYTAAGSLRRA